MARAFTTPCRANLRPQYYNYINRKTWAAIEYTPWGQSQARSEKLYKHSSPSVARQQFLQASRRHLCGPLRRRKGKAEDVAQGLTCLLYYLLSTTCNPKANTPAAYDIYMCLHRSTSLLLIHSSTRLLPTHSSTRIPYPQIHRLTRFLPTRSSRHQLRNRGSTRPLQSNSYRRFIAQCAPHF